MRKINGMEELLNILKEKSFEQIMYETDNTMVECCRDEAYLDDDLADFFRSIGWEIYEIFTYKLKLLCLRNQYNRNKYCLLPIVTTHNRFDCRLEDEIIVMFKKINEVFIIEFDWKDFTKDMYNDYCNEICKIGNKVDEFVGQVRAGELCCDFLTRQNDDYNTVLTYDMFVGGKDTGYGYSVREAMKTGKYKNECEVPDNEKYPYDYYDGETFGGTYANMKYSRFQKEMEMAIIDFMIFSKNYELLEKAAMPLHRW